MYRKGKASRRLPSQMRTYSIASKTPNHRRIHKSNSERRGGRGNKWIGGVQNRPDEKANIAVDKEFLEKQVPLVRLVWVGKRAQYTGDSAVIICCAMHLQIDRFGCLDLRPIAGHKHQTGHK